MPAFRIGEAYYPCRTQDGRMATLDYLPKPEKPSKPFNGDGIVVGLRSLIPRWDVKKQKGRKLQYYVSAETFPSSDYANKAGEVFQKAADQWNALNLGLNIVAAPEKASAHFYIKYREPEDADDTTLAAAFFPSDKDQDVYVWSTSFQGDNINILQNIFEHEIGHILGLRHEFAITGDYDKNLKPENDGAKQFMDANYYSVMSYNFPPTIQQTDKAGVAEFYKLDNGTEIDGLRVTDYVPHIRAA